MPNVNQRLLPPTFPRKAKLLSPSAAFDYVKRLVQQLLVCCTLPERAGNFGSALVSAGDNTLCNELLYVNPFLGILSRIQSERQLSVIEVCTSGEETDLFSSIAFDKFIQSVSLISGSLWRWQWKGAWQNVFRGCRQRGDAGIYSTACASSKVNHFFLFCLDTSHKYCQQILHYVVGTKQ